MGFCLALILYTRYSYFKCAPIKKHDNGGIGEKFAHKREHEIFFKFLDRVVKFFIPSVH